MSRMKFRAMERSGWQIRLFELRSNAGLVLCYFATHPKNGLAFDATSICQSEDRASYAKAERDLLESVQRWIAIKPNQQPLSELAEKGTPIDHWRFYNDPSHNLAIDFLGEPQTSSVTLPSADSVRTVVVTEATDHFPAVAVSYHPDWPSLRWGRRSIEGKNPWPHPLA